MVLGLLNNVRVTVARPPAAEGWNFYVRKFNTIKAGEPEALLTDKNASFAISLLRILVKGCVNLVITGEQASGKTTLLKALVGFIDGRYSVLWWLVHMVNRPPDCAICTKASAVCGSLISPHMVTSVSVFLNSDRISLNCNSPCSCMVRDWMGGKCIRDLERCICIINLFPGGCAGKMP